MLPAAERARGREKKLSKPAQKPSMDAMGFETAALISMASTGVSKAAQAYQEHEQSRDFRKAARATEQVSAAQSDAMARTAMDNSRREQRNAQMQMARARADAGASNLLSAGSAAQRELDLATRLEDEINNRTDAALEEASRIRRQGQLDAWNLRRQSRNARNNMLGSALEAGVNLLGAGWGSMGQGGDK